MQFTKNAKSRFTVLVKESFRKGTESDTFGVEVVANAENKKVSASIVSISERIDKKWNARRKKTFDPSFVILKGIGVCGPRDVVRAYLNHVLESDELKNVALNSLISRTDFEQQDDEQESQSIITVCDDKLTIVNVTTTNDRIFKAVEWSYTTVVSKTATTKRRKRGDPQPESPRPRSPFPGATCTGIDRPFAGVFESLKLQ